MTTTSGNMATGSQLQQFVSIAFDCKCGKKYRVDVEQVNGPYAAKFVQHCSEDDGSYVQGRIVALLEGQDGTWRPLS